MKFKAQVFLFQLVFFVSPAFAHNNLYLPGDSYFSSILSADLFKKSSSNPKDLELKYRRYSNHFMMCGYLGYKSLRVEKLPDTVLSNLKELLSKLSKKNEKVAWTMSYNGEKKFYFPILVYNSDHDINLPLFMKFNENWDSIQTNEGEREHAIWDGVEDNKLRAFELEKAKSIENLKISKNRPALADFMGVSKSLKIDGEHVKFIIPLKGTWEGFAAKEEGLEFYVVDQKIKKFRYEEGKLKEMLQNP